MPHHGEMPASAARRTLILPPTPTKKITPTNRISRIPFDTVGNVSHIKKRPLKTNKEDQWVMGLKKTGENNQPMAISPRTFPPPNPMPHSMYYCLETRCDTPNKRTPHRITPLYIPHKLLLIIGSACYPARWLSHLNKGNKMAYGKQRITFKA